MMKGEGRSSGNPFKAMLPGHEAMYLVWRQIEACLETIRVVEDRLSPHSDLMKIRGPLPFCPRMALAIPGMNSYKAKPLCFPCRLSLLL